MARSRKPVPAETPAQAWAGASVDRKRLEALARVAGSLGGSWRPAPQVLVEVRSVRTIFVQVDLALRCGGWPIERFALVHGPSNHGKTELVLGLGLSFLQGGHFFALVDAERSTPSAWLRRLMGEYVGHPGFVALRPGSYEQAVDDVRAFCEGLAEARVKRQVPEDTTGLVAVDSIRKLAPRKLLKQLMEEGASKGVDGMSGRAAQLKAALNAAWLDELVPLLADTQTAAVAIAREAEDEQGGYRVGGGRALVYDSSLVLRVRREGWVKDPQVVDRIYGERHAVEVRKTKVGPKEERVPVGYYHTSNGLVVPEGFDRARDVLEAAVEVGIVRATGSHYSYGGGRLGHGQTAAVRRLQAEPALLGEVEKAVRDRANGAG